MLITFINDPVAIALSSKYARISLGWALPMIWVETLGQWLRSQRVVLPSLLTGVTCFSLNLGLDLAFVSYFGFVGASI